MSKPTAAELTAARQRGKAEAEQIIGVAHARQHPNPRMVVEGQHDRLGADQRRSLLVAEAAATAREALDKWLATHTEGKV